MFLLPMIVPLPLGAVFGGIRRVTFFAWLTALGKILTMNNLRNTI
jgi:hypothetical protein